VVEGKSRRQSKRKRKREAGLSQVVRVDVGEQCRMAWSKMGSSLDGGTACYVHRMRSHVP
jgi:hypothetical protein